jgi:hypothetical protein
MRKGLFGTLIVLVGLILLQGIRPSGALAQPDSTDPERRPTFSGSFLTFFLWRSDRDFDSSEPIFDEYGQSVGYVAVEFYPEINWRPRRDILIHYLAEIGESFWSRTNTDPRPDSLEEKPVVLHKEFWAQFLLPWEGYGLRFGFQYYYEPTRLFLEKHVGALQGFYRNQGKAFRFTVLQIPDTTYEGADLDDTNFQTDNFVFALDADLASVREMQLRPALLLQYDRSDVDREKFLLNPCVNALLTPLNGLSLELDLAMQVGRWKSRSINNRDLDLLAGAAQIHGIVHLDRITLELNLLAFSPEDGDLYNGRDTSFDYSGFSKSRTLVLSENWLYDQFNNLDEQAAASKAGLFLADLFGRLGLTEGLELFAVLGYGMVLETRFSNGGRTVGTEIDVGLFWHPSPHVRLTALGGILAPGTAGGAFRNELGSLRDTDPMYYFQGAIEVNF